MKAVILSTDRGLRGATPKDEEAFRKFKARIRRMKEKSGQWLRIEFSTPRNIKHHRLLFALLTLIAENSEVYDTTEKALYAVKLCSGYVDPMADPRTGEVIPVPRSIAFDRMDQEEFEQFYAAALDAVCRHIVPWLDEADRDQLLAEIVEGWG